MLTAYEQIMRLGQRRDRAWLTFVGRQRTIGARLDPRTAGDGGLIHNWGNESARAAMARGWKRWHAYADACDVRYRQLARQHVEQTRSPTQRKRDRMTVAHALRLRKTAAC